MKIVGLDGSSPEVLPLNLIFDYPVKWSVFKVLRDFLQNFYDAVGQEGWHDRFSHRIEDDTLIMTGRKIGFSYDWLVPIGASTKRNAPGKYAGYFGEGFKIASLCALRDHGWQVEMVSRDWELRVAVQDVTIDGHAVPSLTYHLWKTRRARADTVLALHPFHDGDHGALEAAVLSFYHPQNPLFGEKIWSGEAGAVWQRSDVAKPFHYPSTYGCDGEGIVFAGFQAMGSIPYPLIIALHQSARRDRERDSFYEMDVVKTIEKVCKMVPPCCAFQMLEAFKRLWSCYPTKKYDFDSWYPIIRRLTKRLAKSESDTRRWRDKYPRLLVAERVKRSDLPNSNRRRQALAWLSSHRPGYRLVQDGFLRLGYPRLETECEQAGGFVDVRMPNDVEAGAIRLLEELTSNVLTGMFGEEPLPPCRIIVRESAAWNGMAVCLRRSEPVTTSHGRRISYRLPYAALKQSTFRKGGFPGFDAARSSRRCRRPVPIKVREHATASNGLLHHPVLQPLTAAERILTGSAKSSWGRWTVSSDRMPMARFLNAVAWHNRRSVPS
jgi:hypothetical protein